MSLVSRWKSADPTSLISGWAQGARWFDKTTGATPTVEVQDFAVLHEDDDSVVLLQLALLDGRLYSLPLQVREVSKGTTNAQGSVGLGVLGAVPDADGALLAVFDATETSVGQRAILNAVLGEDPRESHEGALKLSSVQLHGFLSDLPVVISAQKLRSEQSNTSIIYRFAQPDSTGSVGLILKLFRALAFGYNPDVELMSGMDRAGSGTVPTQYGSVFTEVDGEHVDLIVVQEFLDGATDAWQVMTNSIDESTEFTEGEQIRALGSMTRKVHEGLASAFEVREANDDDRARLRESWRARGERALADAPELEEYREQIGQVFDDAVAGPWPKLQRVHGDYHLGQVLLSPGRGWYALDFEGEPLRPMAERTQVDLALRDVAGMLRSFDYAAGSAVRSGGDEKELGAWSSSAVDAFLDGYGELSADEAELLSALILDKALYEVSYETAARPTWRDIPLDGVRRILESPQN